MLTPEEEELIRERAYLPEHVPPYGGTVSGLEPFLFRGYLYFFREGKPLVFIGYPLDRPPDSPDFKRTLDELIFSRRPEQVALLAPSIPPEFGTPSSRDRYYDLDLSLLRIPPKVANMLRRASRSLGVTRGRTLSPEHLTLIRLFSESRRIGGETRAIFERIPAYLEASPTAAVFSARDAEGKLAAFDIADFWGKHYAFYMFNFRSSPNPLPGASDLLLREIIAEAESRGKARINLGLGINPGVAFFKTKWGARPSLPHETVLFRRKAPSFFESLLRGLR